MPAHTGLTILVCRKRNRRHWKSQNWRAVWIFEWFKPLLNVLKDQQSRELRRIRTTCPAVYLYDYVHKFGHGEMRNKKLKIGKKRHYTRMAVLHSLISPWKRKGKKRKKKLLQHGVFVFGHPSKYYPRPTGLNFVEQKKHVAALVGSCGILWYSDSTVNAFFFNF